MSQETLATNTYDAIVDCDTEQSTSPTVRGIQGKGDDKQVLLETGVIKSSLVSQGRDQYALFQQHNAYRRDIDGLRAVAVTLVVLFHAKVPHIAAGFIGVDMFFVISGFLICISIGRDLAKSNFSFVKYYTRRMWRLQPAFLAMVIPTLIAAYFLADEIEIQNITESAWWAAMISGNTHFAKLNGGYFADDVENIPLIHTWSLAVEWKWYLIFPVLLFCSNKILGPAGMKSFVIVCCLLTSCITIFLPGIIYIVGKPEKDYIQSSHYYSFVLRIFEMAIGSATAIVPLTRTDRISPRIRTILGYICLVSFPVISLFPIENGYPNAVTLIVCIIASLLILVGSPSADKTEVVEQNHCSSLLSHCSMNYIGKISYSIYLFHWPLLWVCRKMLLESQSFLFISAYFLISILVASVSYALVEKFCMRFRNVNIILSFVLLFGTPILGTFVLNHYSHKYNGWPERFPDMFERYSRLNANQDEKGHVIFADYPNAWNLKDFFHYHAPEEKVAALGLGNVTDKSNTILYIGDSHAAHSRLFIMENTNYVGMDVDLLSAGDCMLIPGTYQPVHNNCNQKKEFVDELIDKKYKYVGLTQFWTLYLKDIPGREYLRLYDESGEVFTTFEQRRDAIQQALLNMMKKVISAGSIPILFGDFYDQSEINELRTNEKSFRKCLLAKYKAPWSALSKISCDARDNRHEDPAWLAIHAILAEVKNQLPETILYDYSDLVCDGTTCYAEVDNFPLLMDDAGHLSDYAAYYLGNKAKVNNNPFL